MLNYINQMSLIFILVMVQMLLSVTEGQLQVGFYSQTCPIAESTVQSVVEASVRSDIGNAAILLRLQFHDCFVKGCDGSILIEGADTEQEAQGNLGVGGFGIIKEAKTRLEEVCPEVVSCADIVALAARDAVSLVNGPFYDVLTGRRDGRISKKSLASKLPEPDDSIKLLKSRFAQKGLSDRDLVLLSSGAHTIGKIACVFMQKRLYNFTDVPGGGSDPKINPKFLPKLKAMCPIGGDPGKRIFLDPFTDSVFDDQIFRNIKKGFAVLASDARLNDDPNTKQILDSYLTTSSGRSFKGDFAKAMVKMGNIGVKTAPEGEIRRVCTAVN